MAAIRVAVIDEHEVFRRGVVASLEEDGDIEVVDDEGPEVDVVVVSAAAARLHELSRPAVVCTGSAAERNGLAGHDSVMALLSRRTVTPSQLVAAVRAAAAGLRIAEEEPEPIAMDERSREVLRLLADGADTREISRQLGYSERTIKATIYDIERDLGARNRAQAVAEALRKDLI